MVRKQMNIRLDELTRQAIKRIAEKYNMSESQVITRGILLLEQELKSTNKVPTTPTTTPTPDEDSTETA